MGAQDRYMVELYRKQMESAFKTIDNENFLKIYVGQVEGLSADIKSNIFSWRIKSISITRLAALIPLIFILIWIITFFIPF